MRFCSCNCVCVSCFPINSANRIHHISFLHFIALRVWEGHWLWSLLLFGFFLSLLLLLYFYLNVDCSWFSGLLMFVVWDLKFRCSCFWPTVLFTWNKHFCTCRYYLLYCIDFLTWNLQVKKHTLKNCSIYMCWSFVTLYLLLHNLV